jgi:hypothetical protein
MCKFVSPTNREPEKVAENGAFGLFSAPFPPAALTFSRLLRAVVHIFDIHSGSPTARSSMGPCCLPIFGPPVVLSLKLRPILSIWPDDLAKVEFRYSHPRLRTVHTFIQTGCSRICYTYRIAVRE